MQGSVPQLPQPQNCPVHSLSSGTTETSVCGNGGWEEMGGAGMSFVPVSRSTLCKLLSVLNLPSGKSYAYRNVPGQHEGRKRVWWDETDLRQGNVFTCHGPVAKLFFCNSLFN